MARLVGCLGVLCLSLLPRLTLAQAEPEPVPAPPPPGYAPAPPPGYAPAPPPAGHAVQLYPTHREADKAAHGWLLSTNPEYQAASSQRTTGIILSSVVGGGGLIVGSVAALGWAICTIGERDSYSSGSVKRESCTDYRAVTIGGFVGMVVGLAVGIPVAVSGNRRMKEIRAQAVVSWVPELDFSLAVSTPGLRARWRF